MTQQEAWRPSPEQALLVRAATDDSERGRAAFEEWIAAMDMGRWDGGSMRLLSLLYRNLQRLGVKHPAMSSLKVGYRNAWATNQVALRHLEEVIMAFNERGIETLVLKGAAMILRYYQDSGVRPMSDFDLLVPLAQTSEAITLLVELGWEGAKPLHLLSDDHRSPFHGMGFYHEAKTMGCDLHWHVMHLHLAPVYDAPMWADSEPLAVGRAMSRVLCAEDQLIHLCFHGCINEEGLNIRWLPDALALLKKEPALNWDRLVARCQMLEFARPIAAMLDYLRDEWEMPIPVEVIERLAETPVSYRMQKVYESLNIQKEQRSGWQTFWLLYTQYQLAQPENSRFFPLGFIQFLRHHWSLDGGITRTLNYAWQRTRGVEAEQAKEMVEG